jgi:RNA polymerase sigma factor (sigma-70 family)
LEGHKEGMNVADEDSPDRNMETSQENARVQCALNKLSSHYREVLILKYFAGYSNGEISEMLVDTVGNVKVTMFRARQVFMQAYVELV